jgi:hypothetical protein
MLAGHAEKIRTDNGINLDNVDDFTAEMIKRFI